VASPLTEEIKARFAFGISLDFITLRTFEIPSSTQHDGAQMSDEVYDQRSVSGILAACWKGSRRCRAASSHAAVTWCKLAAHDRANGDVLLLWREDADLLLDLEEHVSRNNFRL